MRIRRPGSPAGLAAGAVLLLLLGAAAPARADWLQPDASFRDAQLSLRLAVRDTVGQPLTAARLDSLGAAHLRLANLGEAGRNFARVLVLAPGDETATAGLGKIALLQDDPARAESLLARLAVPTEDAARDLFHARLRQGRWEQAATLAEGVGEPGRAALLRRLATTDEPWKIEGAERVSLPWIRCWPVPIVKARLNGQPVLLAVETGVADLVLDPSTARRCNVTLLPEQAPLAWGGTHVAARLAIVQQLILGGLRIANVPAATVSLRRWSLEANPDGEPVGGMIGANLLARFTPTLDYRKCRLELAPRRRAPFAPGAQRTPFELWGERKITVYGSIVTGRRWPCRCDRRARLRRRRAPRCSRSSASSPASGAGHAVGGRPDRWDGLVRRDGADRDRRPHRARQGERLLGGARCRRPVAPRRAPRRAALERLPAAPARDDRLVQARAGLRVGPHGTLGAAPGRLGYAPPVRLHYHVMSAPAPRPLFLARTERGLRHLEFIERRSLKRVIAGRPPPRPGAEWHPSLLELKPVVDQLDAYFSGLLQVQRAARPGRDRVPAEGVARARPSRSAHTRSYGEVAQAVGQPRSARAVGLANNQNPVAIVVPCHRVVGADGSLTGYGGGVPRKRWLLEPSGPRHAHQRSRATVAVEPPPPRVRPRRRTAKASGSKPRPAAARRVPSARPAASVTAPGEAADERRAARPAAAAALRRLAPGGIERQQQLVVVAGAEAQRVGRQAQRRGRASSAASAGQSPPRSARPRRSPRTGARDRRRSRPRGRSPR